MQAGIISVVVALVLVVSIFSISQSSPVKAESSSVNFVTRFDATKGELPEGLAVFLGRKYVSMAPQVQAYKIDTDGKMSPYGMWPKANPGEAFMVGMTFDSKKNLYAALPSFGNVKTGVYKVSSATDEATLFATHPDMKFPNDVVFGKKGRMFISDSFDGSIFVVEKDGTVSKWLSSDLLKANSTNCSETRLGFDIGANGLAYYKNNIYVANTLAATILKIPINEDGSAGNPEIFLGPDCSSLVGIDGITIDRDGNIFAAINLQDKIVRISSDKELTVVAKKQGMDFPASIELARHTGKYSLYVTNFGFVNANKGLVPDTGIIRISVNNYQ